MQDGMTIGRVAKAAGVNVETIRYYQRRGLLDEPRKPMGGQRRYPAQAVMKQIGFIRRAQQLGFSLEEVKSLMKLADGRNTRETRAIAERKHAVLETRVAELNTQRRKLKSLIAASLKMKAAGPCPIIAALSKSE